MGKKIISLVVLLIFLISMSNVLAVTWRHSGIDTMTLDNSGNFNVIGNATVGQGATNLQIYFNGSTNVFDTMGQSAYFPDNVIVNNRVGIGDLTPDGTLKLDVEGQVGATEYCDENGANCRTIGAISTADGYIGETNLHRAGNNLDMNGFNITNISNVGIGTTSPNAELHVVGYIAAEDGTSGAVTLTKGKGTSILRKSSDLTGDAGFFFYNNSFSTWEGGISIDDDVSGMGLQLDVTDNYFGKKQITMGNGVIIGSTYTDNEYTAPTNGLIVEGNVGIGTNTPNEKLHIGAGNILLDNNQYLKQKSSGGTSRNILGTGTDDSVRLYSYDNIMYVNPDTGTDTWINYNQNGDVSLVGGTSTGNVGIGTTTPSASYKVDVQGGDLRVGTTGAGKVQVGSIGSLDGSSTTNLVLDSVGGMDIKLDSNANGNAYFRVLGDGTTNVFSVDEDGNIITSGNTDIAGNLTVGGGYAAGGLTIETDGDILTNGDIYHINTMALNASMDVDRILKVGSYDGDYLQIADNGDISDAGGNVKVADQFEVTGNTGLKDATPTNTLDVTGNVRIGAGYDGVAAPANGAIIEGNVGIGENSPGAKLDVVGNIRTSNEIEIERQGAPGNYHTISSPGDNLEIDVSGAARDFIINTVSGATERLRIKGDTGNVGIGDTTPDGTLKLDVEGQVGATEYCDENGANCFTSDMLSGDIYVNEAGDNMTGHLRMQGTDANVALGSNWLSGDGDDEGVFVDSAGNVGIGTNTPRGRLEIGDVDTTDSDIIFDTGSNQWTIGSPNTNDDFYISDNVGFGANARLVIDNTGNVGIGTATPTDNKLVVQGGITTSDGTDQGFIDFRHDRDDVRISENTYVLSMVAPSGLTFDIDSNNNAGGSGLTVMEDSATRLKVLPGGNVGIGVANPDAKLEIGGGSTADEARLVFAASDSSNRFTIETDLDATTGNDLLGFRTTTTDNVLVIKGNGRVAVGNNNPQEELHVTGTTRTTGDLQVGDETSYTVRKTGNKVILSD